MEDDGEWFRFDTPHERAVRDEKCFDCSDTLYGHLPVNVQELDSFDFMPIGDETTMELPPFDLPGLLGPTELLIAGIPVVLAVVAVATWLPCLALSALWLQRTGGRSGCGWFVLGILFGPFGLHSVRSLSPKIKAVLEQRLVQRGEMQYCPYCAELVRAEAIKCRHCRENFGEDQSSSHSPYMRRTGQ